jgi:Predicted membrane protein
MSDSQKDTFYTIVWILFILSASIAITIFASYLLFAVDINYYNLSDIVNLSYSKIMHNYIQMMNYLINPFSGEFHLSDFASSVAGRTHFADCKKLFMLDFVVVILTGIYIYFQRGKRVYFKKMFFVCCNNRCCNSSFDGNQLRSILCYLSRSTVQK